MFQSGEETVEEVSLDCVEVLRYPAGSPRPSASRPRRNGAGDEERRGKTWANLQHKHKSACAHTCAECRVARACAVHCAGALS